MRIALTSYSGYGAWFTRRLVKERHQVSYFIKPEVPEELMVCHGLSVKPSQSKPDYANYHLSVFDLTGRKRAADASLETTPTIGDGSLNCMLEDDRELGLKFMEDAGINVPPHETFNDTSSAIAFVKRSGRRYVLKPFDCEDSDATYVSTDAEDMIGYIQRLPQIIQAKPFLLQEFVTGTEIGIEGWFDGTNFWLLNATLEDKKFMNDNKGPNTGCAGNLVFLIGESSRIYREGLGKAKDLLQQSGFRGMIDLNTIVTEDKAYGLEWTPRFGYDSSPTLMRMYAGDYGEMMGAIASGVQPDALWRSEYGVSVKMTIPPFPSYIRGKHRAGVICTGLDPDRDYLHDCMTKASFNAKDPTLETAGVNGWIASPIITGGDPVRAWEELYQIVNHNIHIPNVQYRTDCDKSSLKKLARLKTQGWV
jgi:phosphoribosylamine-glycine ligase